MPSLPHKEVSEYIIACRGRGLTLHYKDYEMIDSWLLAANHDLDLVLVTLGDVLPNFYAKSAEKRIKFPALSIVHDQILLKLKSAL